MGAGMETARVERLEPAAGKWGRVDPRPVAREAFALAGVLALGGALRLALAARGWPYANSDEATTGLMAYDILHRGAHPAFTYGIHHVGAFGAYLAAPVFLLLGPTNFALHAATTLQTLAFLLALYLLARAVFSRGTALVSIALLALGPEQTLAWTMRAGHYAQDVPLFGALLLWMVVSRVARGRAQGSRLALDAAIGLTAGLGIWCSLLFSPFALAAALVLGIEARRRSLVRRQLLRELAIVTTGALVGMASFLAAAVTSGGAVFREALAASSTAGSGPSPGPLGALVVLGQQVAATLFFGLPSMFGSRTVCGCPLWPSPLSHPTSGAALADALVGTVFTAFLAGCWLAAVLPLVRGVRAAWAAHRAGAGTPFVAPPVDSSVDTCSAACFDARWWGRAMLVVAGGLTVAQYALSRASYVYVDTAPRYLVGVWVCMPLLADPLWRAVYRVWQWVRVCAAGRAQFSRAVPPGAFLLTILLAALVVVGMVGAGAAFGETANRDRYGVPAGERDVRLIAFLEAHGATRFTTTWWVCHRLMFDSAERLTCAVVDDHDALKAGFNPMPAYAAEVAAVPHPAYVFDLTTGEVDPSVPHQLAARIAAGDPRFAGYTSAVVAGYAVFYYPVTAR